MAAILTVWERRTDSFERVESEHLPIEIVVVRDAVPDRGPGRDSGGAGSDTHIDRPTELSQIAWAVWNGERVVRTSDPIAAQSVCGIVVAVLGARAQPSGSQQR